MTKKFAQYLTTLITNDVENKMSEGSMGISSYECEKVEAALMADKFDDVEKWVDGKAKKQSESKTMSRVQFDPVSRRFSISSGKHDFGSVTLDFKGIKSIREVNDLVYDKLGVRNLEQLGDMLKESPNILNLTILGWYQIGKKDEVHKYLGDLVSVVNEARDVNKNIKVALSK